MGGPGGRKPPQKVIVKEARVAYQMITFSKVFLCNFVPVIVIAIISAQHCANNSFATFLLLA